MRLQVHRAGFSRRFEKRAFYKGFHNYPNHDSLYYVNLGWFWLSFWKDSK